MLTFLAGATLAVAADTAIPSAIQAPAGETLLLRAHATGVQIYSCGQGADGKPQWTLKGPDAELRDRKGKIVAHHFAGPAWKSADGSEVIGRAVAHVDAPDEKSIPWLLLSATSHHGEGAFAAVTSIQRIHTKGGAPPAVSQCDPSKPSADARSPYSADYYFYGPSK